MGQLGSQAQSVVCFTGRYPTQTPRLTVRTPLSNITLDTGSPPFKYVADRVSLSGFSHLSKVFRSQLDEISV
jgi:hypothetical protein